MLAIPWFVYFVDRSYLTTKSIHELHEIDPLVVLRLRLLLSDAVDGSHAPNQRFAVDTHHSPIREDALQYIKCALIVFVIENRGEHHIICDVEVGVGSGKPIKVSRIGA